MTVMTPPKRKSSLSGAISVLSSRKSLLQTPKSTTRKKNTYRSPRASPFRAPEPKSSVAAKLFSSSSFDSSSRNSSCSEEADEAVKVCVRIRPLLDDQSEVTRAWEVGPSENTVVSSSDSSSYYTFASVFGETSSTQRIYDEIGSDIVQSVVRKGQNGTLFTYGQTATGKTHTMQGMILSAGRDLFENLSENDDDSTLTSIKIACIEVYNENVRDLLIAGQPPTLSIQEDRDGNVVIPNLLERQISNVNELLEAVQIAEENRSVGSNNINERSSRSHTIFRLTYTKKEVSLAGLTEDKENGSSDGRSCNKVIETTSVLSLVDLAGSESVRVTKATGDRQKEGGKINQSLLTLSRVLEKLGKKNQHMHVNYRDSKLTRLLKPSLAGNARMACVCCISPAMQYAEESRSTLEFASRTMLVTTNAKTNQKTAFDDALVSEFEAELERVRLETTKAEEERLQMEKSLTEARKVIVSLQATNSLHSARIDKLETLNDEAITQLECVSAKNRCLVDELRVRDDKLDQRAEELSEKLEEAREEHKTEVHQLNETAKASAETIAGLETQLESITLELKAAKEQEARHKEEARELKDSHSFEMSKMKEEHAAEIKCLHTEASDRLRSQQEAFEAKVMSIEESHSAELESKQRELMDTHDIHVTKLTESNNNKISEINLHHDAEINNLYEKMDANVMKLQEKATENISLMEQEATYKVKSLTDAHETHVKALIEAHTAETTELNRENKSLREKVEERLKELHSKQLIIETLTTDACEVRHKLEGTERELEESIEHRKTERVLLEKRLEAYERQIIDLNMSTANATDKHKVGMDQSLPVSDLGSENIPLQGAKRWKELLANATDRIDELERSNAALSNLLDRERKKALARKQETSQRRKMFKAKLSGLADTLKEDRLQLSYNKEESP